MSPRIIRDTAVITIYQIEGRFPPGKGQYAGEWCARNLTQAYFGEKAPRYGDSWKEICPTYCEYGANGACWQRTGCYGWLEMEPALSAFSKLRRHAPYCESVAEWRLVRRQVAVAVDVVSSFKTKPYQKRSA